MPLKKILPDCWWITPDIASAYQCAELLTLLNMRISQGISHIQFRQTQLSLAEFVTVYQTLDAYCQDHQIFMIINGTLPQMQSVNAKGYYLNSDILMQCQQRPWPDHIWVGAYCHHLTELLHAQKINLDFVSLSPVKKTLSHPEQEPLGWDTFQTLVEQTTLPVYALGGLSLTDKSQAIACNGAGIMGIRFDYTAA